MTTHVTGSRYAISIIQALRNAGIEEGMLIRYNGVPHLVYQFCSEQYSALVAHPKTGKGERIQLSGIRQDYKAKLTISPELILHKPQPGFAHPLLAFHWKYGETFSYYRDRILPLIPKVAVLLKEHERYSTEYGDFWSIDVVRGYEKTLRPFKHVEIKKAHDERLYGKKGFCLYCAVQIPRATAKSCGECQNKKAAQKPDRYCCLCGTVLSLLVGEQRKHACLCLTCEPTVNYFPSVEPVSA